MPTDDGHIDEQYAAIYRGVGYLIDSQDDRHKMRKVANDSLAFMKTTYEKDLAKTPPHIAKLVEPLKVFVDTMYLKTGEITALYDDDTQKMIAALRDCLELIDALRDEQTALKNVKRELEYTQERAARQANFTLLAGLQADIEQQLEKTPGAPEAYVGKILPQ